MLRKLPYGSMDHPQRSGGNAMFRPYVGKRLAEKSKMKMGFKMMMLTIFMVGIYVSIDLIGKVIVDLGFSSTFERSLLCSQGYLLKRLGGRARKLCEVDTELESDSFETVFSAVSTNYTADYNTPRPGGSQNVAFVVTIPSCPEDAVVGSQDDPRDAFYDAAAVLRDSVCNCTATNPASGSKYSSTMYAIIHPDAVLCAGPTTEAARRSLQSSYEYDRVKVLQELGYWVMIWGEPLSMNELPTDKAEVATQETTRDLMRLYALNFTDHSLAMMVKFDTVITDPLDGVFDVLIGDNDKKALYVTKDGSEGNAGAIIVKTGEDFFDDVLQTYKATPYNPLTGWDQTSIVGLDTEGFLSYYFSQNSVAYEQLTNPSILSFGSNSECGLPWDCKYDENWDTATENECLSLNLAWYGFLLHFQENNWNNQNASNVATGTYYSNFFLGHCTESGNAGFQSITLEVAPPTSPAPISPAPVSPAPVSPAPVSPAPVTPSPVSSTDAPTVGPTPPSAITAQPTGVPTYRPTSETTQYATPSYLYPLTCNENVTWDCTLTPLSSLAVPTDGSPLVIPCGTCVHVDTTNGDQLNLPNGLRIEGMLYFPAESSITIRTIYVFVLGILKMDNPLVGNEAKFSLYGEEDTYFLADSGQCSSGSGCKMGKKPIAVVGGQLDIQGFSEDCPSWENVLDTSDYDGSKYNQIQLSQKAAECWTQGSEIVITSSTSCRTCHQVVTINSTNPALGTLDLASGINAVSTVASDPLHAVEVALLSRRIVFEADDDPNDDLIGGHLIIFLTPSVEQLIEGVEFRNFGQQGNVGRYPIHFHICDDGYGSIVRKNVVRESNQRCYVMHGTNGVRIEDNVAFDTKGHCFMTEDGGEYDNYFMRNIGIHVRDASRLVNSGRSESDDRSSVFWMSSMENYFEGNVVAGCESSGYWAETHAFLAGRGGSVYQRPDHMPMFVGLGSFKDNVAHSFGNEGFTSYPPGWLPGEEVVVENFRAYRGKKSGILVHNTKNIRFKGGYIAQIQATAVVVFGADNIVIEDMEIVGHLEGESELCYNNQHTAVTLYPYRAPTRERYQAGQNFVAKLHNITLTRWSPKATCPYTPLMDINTVLIRKPGFGAYLLMDNIYHDDSNPLITSACMYNSSFGDDTAIEVSGDATTIYGGYGGSGYLVGSVNLPFADSGSGCFDVDGCLHFCPGTCLRTINFLTNGAQDTWNYVMKVSDGNNTTTIDRNYNFFDVEKSKRWKDYDSEYSVSLPSGSFTVWFEDENGAHVYPKFVHPFFEAEPTCSGYATLDSITILKPPADDPRCDDLINNGDFTFDTIGWQRGYDPDYFWNPTAGMDGTGALLFEEAPGGSFITQWLDMSCLVGNDGEYLFRAYYRIVDQLDDVSTAQDVNPSKWPIVNIIFKGWDNETQKLSGLPGSSLILPPTSSPTVNSYPQLTIVGGNELNGLQSLDTCEGDCDSDMDCQVGLECFQRSGIEPVPGCTGSGSSTRDYCYNPNHNDDFPQLEIIGNNELNGLQSLGRCQGDCDSDMDCQPFLVCMQRSGDEPVPGCNGSGSATRDYCYDPNIFELKGFHVISGSFIITPEQAAGAAARLRFYNFAPNFILDKVSLVKAP